MPQPISILGTLPSTVDPSVRRLARNIAAIIDDPLAHMTVSPDTEGATAVNTRRLTIQFRNRRKEELHRSFVAHIWVAVDAAGGPQAAQTASFVAGTVLQTVLPDGHWVVETDATGRVALDVTIAGAATRFLRGFVLAQADTSDPLLWS